MNNKTEKIVQEIVRQLREQIAEPVRLDSLHYLRQQVASQLADKGLIYDTGKRLDDGSGEKIILWAATPGSALEYVVKEFELDLPIEDREYAIAGAFGYICAVLCGASKWRSERRQDRKADAEKDRAATLGRENRGPKKRN